jgi:hypothetical protein
MRHIASACGLLALTVALAGCSQREGTNDPIDVKADIAAAGVQRLVLDGSAGKAHISVSPDDQVHVQLELKQDQRRILGVSFMSESTTQDLAAVKVGQQRDGDALKLSTAYPSGGTHSDVKEDWNVQVPARFGVEAEMTAGRMVIEGVTGGVKTTLSAGETVIHVPSGPVYGRMSAGRLHVISDSAQPGKLSIKSTFGLAILDLQGTYYGPPEQHGGFHMFGNSVHQQSSGKDDMDLKVTAGLADLRVGPQGDEKEYRDLFSDEADKKIMDKAVKDAVKKSVKDDDQDDDDDDDQDDDD